MKILSKIKECALCAVAIVATVSAFAQNSSGRVIDVKIYFPYDQARIDSTYMDNHNSLHRIDSLLTDSSYLSTISTIEVAVQSSPEGSVAYNSRLSARREASLRRYFAQRYPDISDDFWSYKTVAEDWREFRDKLESDENLPHRDQILDIVHNDHSLDAKEWQLRTMNSGDTWLYIKEHILPSQRFGASVHFTPNVFVPIARSAKLPTNSRAQVAPAAIAPAVVGVAQDEEDPRFIFAIKSNLVLDLLSVINIGVEIPIGERWSVVGEVVHPWWRSWSADYTMQIESYHAELKYWLGDRDYREQLHGWSLGVYGGWGRYDIQPFSKSGVQGEFTDFGLELGYAHSIARNLNLEYTVGLGFVSTGYVDYNMARETDEYGDIKVIPYPWKSNSVKAILPTRCGISLVWVIQNKRGGKR